MSPPLSSLRLSIPPDPFWASAQRTISDRWPTSPRIRALVPGTARRPESTTFPSGRHCRSGPVKNPPGWMTSSTADAGDPTMPAWPGSCKTPRASTLAAHAVPSPGHHVGRGPAPICLQTASTRSAIAQPGGLPGSRFHPSHRSTLTVRADNRPTTSRRPADGEQHLGPPGPRMASSRTPRPRVYESAQHHFPARQMDPWPSTRGGGELVHPHRRLATVASSGGRRRFVSFTRSQHRRGASFRGIQRQPRTYGETAAPPSTGHQQRAFHPRWRGSSRSGKMDDIAQHAARASPLPGNRRRPLHPSSHRRLRLGDVLSSAKNHPPAGLPHTLRVPLCPQSSSSRGHTSSGRPDVLVPNLPLPSRTVVAFFRPGFHRPCSPDHLSLGGPAGDPSLTATHWPVRPSARAAR